MIHCMKFLLTSSIDWLGFNLEMIENGSGGSRSKRVTRCSQKEEPWLPLGVQMLETVKKISFKINLNFISPLGLVFGIVYHLLRTEFFPDLLSVMNKCVVK